GPLRGHLRMTDHTQAISFSRCVFQHPSYGKRILDSSPPGFDPVVHAEVQQAKRRWECRASETSAWIAGHRRNEVTPFCERLSHGNDERKNERERTKRRKRIGSRTPTDAMQPLSVLLVLMRAKSSRPRTEVSLIFMTVAFDDNCICLKFGVRG